ncbi:hypothetical protein [Thermococcus thioreducens]|uniref:Uncharacterized protein n=1 Tax=Thermococcus thioreducens TaxID=277988 RepID=A0A0Q2S5X7_9EURY|nr:hypothetical protein [Thermococcus thioreducens]ASJ13139.1 hypothetical protein A3L14_09680 [Thermococcus thioreducens]KQH82859.1 hypothetical protein AMR53_03300 [Thermococcus thioreducens]SEW19953.1 hypothetical protein SAMN05216170_2035 [Thermococcus thioreducens]
MKVMVMRPIFKPGETSNPDFVLYPYHIFHLRLFYKRLGRSDRVFDYFAYVDLYRLGAERGDGFIDLYEWDVEEKKVMEPLVDYEEAKMKAFESAITWGNSRVVSWWLPRIEIIREAQAYKVFWIFEKNREKFLMDSLEGKEFSLEKLVGKDGRKCKGAWCR